MKYICTKDNPMPVGDVQQGRVRLSEWEHPGVEKLKQGDVLECEKRVRCKHCHWDFPISYMKNRPITVDELIEDIKREAFKATKEAIPDEPGQDPETLNAKQEECYTAACYGCATSIGNKPFS